MCSTNIATDTQGKISPRKHTWVYTSRKACGVVKYYTRIDMYITLLRELYMLFYFGLCMVLLCISTLTGKVCHPWKVLTHLHVTVR